MKLAVLLLTLLGNVVTIQSYRTVLIPHPGGIGGIFKGPNSETIINGPDGSIITAEDEGGAVRTGIQPIAVAEETVSVVTASVAPVVVEQVASVAVAPVLPVAESVPLTHQSVRLGTKEPHVINTELVDAPLVEPNEAADLVGPSGSISRRGSSSIVSGPASTTISEPVRPVVAPVAAVPVVANTVVAPIETPVVSSVQTANTVALSSAVLSAGSLALPVASLTSQISTASVENAAPVTVSTLPPPTLISTQTLNLRNGAGIVGRGFSTLAPIEGTLSLSTPAPYNNIQVQAQQDYSAALVNYDQGSSNRGGLASLSTPAPYSTVGTRGNLQVQSQQDYSEALANYDQSNRNRAIFASNAGTSRAALSLSTPAPYSAVETGGNFQVQTQQVYSAPSSASYDQINSDKASLGARISGVGYSTLAPSDGTLSISTPVPYNTLISGANLQIQDNSASLNYDQDRATGIGSVSRESSDGTLSLSTPAPYSNLAVGANVEAQQDCSAPIRRKSKQCLRQRNPTWNSRPRQPLFQINTKPKQDIVSSTSTPLFVESNTITSSQGTDSSGAWGYQQNVVYGTESDDAGPGQAGAAPAVPTGVPSLPVNSRLPAYNRNLINSQQIGINPANIPSRNIVPPEIKLPPLPKGTIDLGATVTVTSVPVPQARGLATSNADQSLNQVGNVVVYNSGNLERGQESKTPYTAPNSGRSRFTEPNEPDWRGTLLRNPSPIEQQSDVNAQLNQQGIDASQINFEQVPLSSASAAPAAPSSFYDVYEDTGLELANRYGRRSRSNA